ncbi:MAG: type II toxin-antitoxin system VapC family toxin [Acidobacteriota bacterium]|nr:type II toxin-antitoxin system VapC family toxin [Acidobacteriota bacterium]
MNGNKGVFDSNIIIFFSKRKFDIDELSSKYAEIYVSIVSYIEVYAYEFEYAEEKLLTDRFLKNVEILEVNKEIADLAIVYRKNKTKKIKLPDAIILASAKSINADLITDDYRDFQNIDPTVNVMNLDAFKI